MKTSIRRLAFITVGTLTFAGLSLSVNQQSLAVGLPDSVHSVDQNSESGFPQGNRPEINLDFLLNKKQTLTQAAPDFASADHIIAQLSEQNDLDFKARQTLFRELKSLGLRTSPEKRLEITRQTRSLNPVSGATPRIIGGSSAGSNQFPWQAALVNANSRNLFQDQFCGGSIISSRWILTAAHCVNGSLPKDIDVVTGLVTLPSAASRQNTSKVKQIIVHPNWADDVALLELTSPLKFGANRQAIELAGNAAPVVNIGDPMTISGWGVVSSFFEEFEGEEYEFYDYPSTLQFAQTPAVACPEEWLDTTFYGVIVCAGSAAPGAQPDSCYGDSGGPLAVFDAGKWSLVGVTSFGASCPPSGIGAYADVRNYAPWIMCHAEVIVPYGGPYFCGDEDGSIDVADTLKVARGGWGTSQATITWFANGVPIAAASNKTSLSLAGRYGQDIDVRISSGGSIEDYPFGIVGEATYIKFFSGSDFVPCTSVKVFEPNKGKCNKNGEDSFWSGSLESSPGLQLNAAENTLYSFGFWASKDFDLPKGTTAWTWGVAYAHAHGNSDLNLGGEFYGIYGSATPTRPDSWGDGYEFPVSENYLGYTEDESDFEDVIVGPVSDPEAFMSGTLVKGKGRLILGTYGSPELGSHFTFNWGMIVASYR